MNVPARFSKFSRCFTTLGVAALTLAVAVGSNVAQAAPGVAGSDSSSSGALAPSPLSTAPVASADGKPAVGGAEQVGLTPDTPAATLALPEYTAIGCGICDVGTMCTNLGGQACLGMTNAIAGGYAMEATLGGALFGGLGTVGGAVVGTGLGAIFGALYVFLAPTRSQTPSSGELIASALVFGVIGAVIGALLGLGSGVVFGIQNGPALFQAKPPPPPPKAERSRERPGYAAVGDVFAY